MEWQDETSVNSQITPHVIMLTPDSPVCAVH